MAAACTAFELLLSLPPTGLKKCSIVSDMSVRKHCMYKRRASMGNVHEINVHECDIIHKIRENLYREHFHAYGIGFMCLMSRQRQSHMHRHFEWQDLPSEC